MSRHVTVTGDTDLGDELLPALRGGGRRAPGRHPVRHRASTRPTGCSPRAPPGTALTWMDARVYGVPVTPRTGKPVEVNALWINGLAGLAELTELAGQDADRAVATARPGRPRRSGSGSRRRPAGCTTWWTRPRRRTRWAGAAPRRRPAPPQPAAGLVAAVRPAGAGRGDAAPGRRRAAHPARARAASPPTRRASSAGTGAARPSGTAAYHQGTVWPWLLGPYVDACRRAGLPVDDLFVGIEAHLTEYGLGSVSETADGARAARAPPAARSRRGRSPSCCACGERASSRFTRPATVASPLVIATAAGLAPTQPRRRHPTPVPVGARPGTTQRGPHVT